MQKNPPVKGPPFPSAPPAGTPPNPPAPGAHVGERGVDYRAWAPDFFSLHVVVTGARGATRIALERNGEGFWRGRDPLGQAGDRYHFQTPDGQLLPDVASRFQPQGVHGPSECIDPRRYRWKCPAWRRPAWRGQSIYELHVGTFTPEGTFAAAIGRLDTVAELGVEAIQVMPVADFPGNRNWGYDGVALYAPARCYGRPDDFRALIDAAHARGLAVVLDVVYNHLGPVGNYLRTYCRDYFSTQHATPWGAALNLDGPRSGPVRDFLLGNAIYWLDEFRVDGLRLDATHAMPDSSDRHLLAAMADAVHDRGGFVIAEDDRNYVELLHDPSGRGYGFDAAWSDDFHHQVRVALTGRREAYFASYTGTAGDLADTLQHGWTYRGQSYPFWENRPRGGPCRHLPAAAFVVCIENHDQVGNRARGERLEHLVTPAQFRAASVLLCLSPYAPLLFMGQEWAASSPFLYFTDHEGAYGRQVSEGRRREFEKSGFYPGENGGFPDPQEEAMFQRSKLNWNERKQGVHRGLLELYRRALKFRRIGIAGGFTERSRWQVAAIGDAVALRYQFESSCWLLLVSFVSGQAPVQSSSELLRPPAGRPWVALLNSEATRFGGGGGRTPEPEAFTGPAAVLYEARKESRALA